MTKQKTIRAILFFGFLSLYSPAYSEPSVKEDDACTRSQSADKELNEVYQSVLTKKKNDKLLVQKLKSSQRAWISFRDAELEAIYPAKDKKGEYGSVYTSCYCGDQTRLTLDRIRQLKTWLDTPAEGEVCRGSRT